MWLGIDMEGSTQENTWELLLSSPMHNPNGIIPSSVGPRILRQNRELFTHIFCELLEV